MTLPLYYMPVAARRWHYELSPLTSSLRHFARDTTGPAWLGTAISLAADPAVRSALARCPETVALLPPALAVVRHVLHDLAEGREPSVRALVYGEPGAGKTTLGLYLVAAAYGMATGLCDGTAGEVRERGGSLEWAEPPLLDCRMEHSSPDPPPEWEWLARQAVATVESLAEAVRAYVESAKTGEPLRYWAALIDEAGAGDLGTATFWIDRKRYAAASLLAQVLRTGYPYVVMTAPSLQRVSRAARELMTYRIYMAVAKRVIALSEGSARVAVELPRGLSGLDVISVRVDVMTRKRSLSPLPAHVSAVALLAEGLLPRDALRQPRWFYERHVRLRLERVEMALRVVQEGREGGEGKRRERRGQRGRRAEKTA